MTTGRGLGIVGLLLLIVGLAHAGWRMAAGLDGTFRSGFLGANPARYAIAGRNYDRHGFTAHLGAADFTPGAAADRPPALYLHHPPGAPLLVGLSFRLLGVSERSATLPFYVVGLLALLVLYGLARRCLTGVGAGAAVAMAAAAPMTGVYGGHVDPQGPLLVIFLLAAVWLHLRARASGSARDRWLAALAILGGLLVDWPAGSLALFLALLSLRDGGDGARVGGRRAWHLPTLAGLFFLGYLAWMVAIGCSPIEDLLKAAGVRTALPLAEASTAQVAAQAGRAGGWFVTMMTPPLLGLAGLGLLPWIRRRAARPTGDLEVAAVALGATGLLHVMMFPQGALIHDYWTFLLLPPLALLAGAAVEALRRPAASRGGEGFQWVVVFGLVLSVFWCGDRATRELIRGTETEQREVDAALGRLVREQTRPHERVLTNLDRFNPVRTTLLVVPQFTYYADRALRGAVRTEADHARAVAEEGEFDVYLHVPLGAEEPPLVTALRARGAPAVAEVLGLRVEFFRLP